MGVSTNGQDLVVVRSRNSTFVKFYRQNKYLRGNSVKKVWKSLQSKSYKWFAQKSDLRTPMPRVFIIQYEVVNYLSRKISAKRGLTKAHMI